VPDETPENTVIGFRRAVELGLDGVELDVQLCRSGELVIIHDEEVDKVTDGSGPVAELTFDELRRLDAGSHYAPEFAGERIPTLEEVLDVLGGAMIVNIELKTRSILDSGLETAVVRLVEKMNVQSSVILSSFNPCAVRRVKKENPELVAALLFAEDQPIHLRRAWGLPFLDVDGIHPRYPLISEKVLRRAEKKSWFVCTWTVDDAAVAAAMFGAGVDIVITNHPAMLRRELET
jgi:glycerophosphoryl diester phosphodiesterase